MIDYDYPDIFLGEAVQKDLLITDGEVTVVGDDYTVTDDTVTITNSELETEAFELHQSINSDMQLRFGSCESAYISFVFRTQATISSLIGKVLKVYIIPNHEASKILQIGVFKVQSDKLSYDGLKRNIVAYDAMYDILNSDVTEWYDTILQDEESTCTIEDLRDTFLNQFALDVEQIGLINDYVTIRRTIDPERLSGADVIRSICEINGVFGMITNEGKFRYVTLSQNIRTLGGGLRYDMPSSQYMEIRNEDYDSKAITAVRIITDNDSCTEVTPEYQQSRNTYTISNNFLISDFKGGELQLLTGRLRVTIGGRYYQPTSLDAIGNPVLEVGDPLCITTKRGEVYTYILQRHMRGIQALRDTYTANGEEYYSDNLNSTQSRYSQLSQQIAQSSASSIVTANNDFVEIIRNIGFRLLDEPSNVSVEYDEDNNEVSLKWTDPADISTLEPVPCEWAGTVVVRNDDHAPLHRWDGTLIEDSTTRDEYSVNALVDNTVEDGKTYYYGIFPYHVALDDVSNPIKHYRYTKTLSIDVPKSGIYVFRTNQNIKVDPHTLEPIDANLLVTDTFGNSWAKYYDNQLIVCGGTRISGDSFNIRYQREISGVTYTFKYLYIAVDDSGNTYPNYSYCNKFKEIAYFGIPNYSSVNRFLLFNGGDMSVSNSEQHRYINIGNLTRYKPQNLYRLFYYNCNLDDVENLNNLDTSELTGDYAFYETFGGMLNIANAVFNKLANWVINNNVSLSGTFVNSSSNDKSYRISDIYAIENWNTSHFTDLSDAFVGVRLTRILNLDTRNVESFYETYLNCEQLTNVDLTNYRFDSLRHAVTSGSSQYTSKGFGGMFRLCINLTTFTMGHEYTSGEGMNFRDTFEECSNLVTANMGTLHNTSNDLPIFFNNTFHTCTALRNFSVVYDGFVAFYMTFYKCTHIEIIDIHPTVVSKCHLLDSIFYGCSALKEVNLNNLDLSYFTQSSSLNMVFTGCNAITTIHCPYAVSSNYSIALPKTMYDSNGNSYSTLPGGNITIYSTNPAV